MMVDIYIMNSKKTSLNHSLILLFAGLLLSFYAHPITAGEESIRKSQFNLENGVAIQGYDPVSYFTKNRAEKGNASISLTYRGIIYNFSSVENRKLFQSNPEKYEPQYGGWCAYAMGDDGSKVEIDPATFKIVNGKLYLFYNFYFINTLVDWNKDESRLKSRADKFWARYIKN